jgi:hypothetical protein
MTLLLLPPLLLSLFFLSLLSLLLSLLTLYMPTRQLP